MAKGPKSRSGSRSNRRLRDVDPRHNSEPASASGRSLPIPPGRTIMPTITPLQPLFAARVSGLDLAQDLDDATFATVRDAFERYSVLVFPGQTITDGQQVRFSERFGRLEATRAGANGAGSKLIVLTNIAADGGLAAPTDKQVLSPRADESSQK